jgi:L-glyceraldehyde 3-phosphate reductase
MALSWLLKDERVTSVLVGASSPEQLEDNIKTIENIGFSKDELNKIEGILKD